VAIAPSTELLAPEEILRLDEAGADRLLDRLDAEVPVMTPVVDLPRDPVTEAIVFGDTHGDWRSTVRAAARFLESPQDRCLVGLGDYVDRAPEDSGEGSVANALYLLQLAALAPGRVILIQGNHETTRAIPAIPHDLPEEVDQLWGPTEERYQRIVGLLERGPLAAVQSEGAYLAHAGFPRGALPAEWRTAFEKPSEDRLAEIVWAECAQSRNRRGATVPFQEADLLDFLQQTRLACMLRGHDPDLTGRPVYHGRCLTVHTCRLYERFGGVILVRLPLNRPVKNVEDLRIEHLATEGQQYEPPN
jgi:hypothetical protein